MTTVYKVRITAKDDTGLPYGPWEHEYLNERDAISKACEDNRRPTMDPALYESNPDNQHYLVTFTNAKHIKTFATIAARHIS